MIVAAYIGTMPILNFVKLGQQVQVYTHTEFKYFSYPIQINITSRTQSLDVQLNLYREFV